MIQSQAKAFEIGMESRFLFFTLFLRSFAVCKVMQSAATISLIGFFSSIERTAVEITSLSRF